MNLGGNREHFWGEYDNSLFKCLKSVYPDYDWLPWKFRNKYDFFEENEENAKVFLDWVQKNQRMKDLSGWYQMPYSTFRELGGGPLLNKHGSLYNLLKTVYPEYPWIAWKFPKVPIHFWNSKENQIKFMEWAKSQLQIKEVDDWYNVSTRVRLLFFVHIPIK